MTRTLLNFFFLLIFVGSAVAYGQSCPTTVIEDDLYSPSLIETCDFNGDNKEDVVFLDSLSNHLYWKRNTGSDDFASAVALLGGAEIEFLTSADLNDDGYDEIIIATNTTIYYIIYTGPTSIDFSDLYTVPVLYNIDALAIGDFDNDGHDGMVLSYSRASTLNAKIDVINNDDSDLSLQNIYDATVGYISDLAVGDINGNGKMDIASGGYNNFWFRNTGTGTFADEVVISSASSDFGNIALMDYDTDDDVELIVLSSDGDLLAYGIDVTGGGWLYDPVNLMTVSAGSPQTWEHTALNGNDVLLFSTENEIVALENIGDDFEEVTYCSGISGLNGLTLFHRQDGYIEFVLSRESAGTIETVNEPETNAIDDNNLVQFDVYPNPASQFVTILLENGIAISRVQAVNTLGQSIELTKQINDQQYSVAHLSTGLYQLVITDQEGQHYTASFVKKD